MRLWKCILPLLASTLCFAVQPDRISGAIQSGQMVVLPGHLRRLARPEYDQGAVDGGLQLKQVTLLTLPTPTQQKALASYVSQQQNPNSPNFHKWLTPEQWAERFGLSQNDVQKISAWLSAQGFSSVSVARGRNWFSFNATASQVQNAFRTEIHHYNVNGEMHFAAAVMPSVPSALAGIAVGLRGLDDFNPQPRAILKAPAAARNAKPNFYDSSFTPPDFVAPGDIETIYDLTPLYTAGFNGAGQKLVIVGQTDVYLSDLNYFRSGFGLAQISGCATNGAGAITACNTSNFEYILDGADPGVSLNDLTEADLDLEWSAATAPGAQIIFVNSTNVFTSYYYAVDNDLAPVISMSYGTCEFDDNELPADETELLKSNSFGITFLNSSGDSGAAECDSPTNSGTKNLATGGLALSYPASSPEVTGVGGTAISYPNGFSSTYWGSSNSTNGGTAQDAPLPETAWNDDVELSVAYPQSFTSALNTQESYAIVSSGGGVSNCSVQNSTFSECVSGFAQPSWQTVTIPNQAGGRFSPDVALLGSPNFPGYIYCTPIEELSSTSPYNSETTSSCANGITSAVNGIPNGSSPIVNPSIVGGTSASSPIFAGIITILNQYLSVPGGLGNINPTLYKLAQTPSNGAFHPVTSGSNVVYCQGATPVSPWPASLQCPGATGTTGSIGYDASNADAISGYNLVTGLGSVDANLLATSWKASITPDFALSASPTSVSVSAGQVSAPITLTISAIAGSTGTVVNFSPSSCAGLPAGATCSFSPISVTFDGTDPVTTTLTISTLGNMAVPSTAQAITITPTSPSNVSTTVSLTVTANTTQSFTLTALTTNFSVMPGGTAAVNIMVNGMGSPLAFSPATLPLTFTCTGLPSETTGTFSPGTGTCSGGSSISTTTGITLNLVTTAPVTKLESPFGHGRQIFYALLFPGVFGVVLAAGARPRGVRMLGMILVLGLSTMWLGSCGGSSSSSQNNPGTTPGTYSVVVTATTGGANPIVSSKPQLTITLTVQ